MAGFQAYANLDLYDSIVRDPASEGNSSVKDQAMTRMITSIAPGNFFETLALTSNVIGNVDTATFVAGELKTQRVDESTPANKADTDPKVESDANAKVETGPPKWNPSLGGVKVLLVNDQFFGSHIDVFFTISYHQAKQATDFSKVVFSLRMFFSNLTTATEIVRATGTWSGNDEGAGKETEDEKPGSNTENAENNKLTIDPVKKSTAESEDAENLTNKDDPDIVPTTSMDAFSQAAIDKAATMGYKQVHFGFNVYYKTLENEDDVTTTANATGQDLDYLSTYLGDVDNPLTHFIILHRVGTHRDNQYPRGLNLFTESILDDEWTPRVTVLRQVLNQSCSSLHLLCTAKEAVNMLSKLLSAMKPANDVSSWWTPFGMSLQDGQNQLPRDEWPKCVIPRTIVFNSHEHYLTQQWLSVKSEQDFAQSSALTELTTANARFLEVAETDGNGFIMLIQEDEHIRLQSNDSIKVTFTGYERSTDADMNWHGKVLPTPEWVPLGDTAIFLKRGRKADDSAGNKKGSTNTNALAKAPIYNWSTIDIPKKHLISLSQQKDMKTIQELLEGMESLTLSIRIVPDSKHCKRITAALNKFFLSWKKETDNHHTIAHETVNQLLATNISQFRPLDLYAPLITAFNSSSVELSIETLKNPLDKKETPNPEQTHAFAVARCIPAGFLIMSGSAGTGKTYAAIKLTQPFHTLPVANSDFNAVRFPGLYVSGINENVNDLTHKVFADIRSGWASKGIQRDPIVVRIHQMESERQMYRRDASSQRPDKPTSIFSIYSEDDAPEYTKEILQFVQRSLAVPTPGVNNRNFRLADQSLAQHILHHSGWASKTLGIERHPFAHPDTTLFAGFRNCLDELLNNAIADKHFNQRLTEEANVVMRSVLALADAVVTTPNLALEEALVLNFHPAFVIVDEAIRLTDPEFAGLVYLYRRDNKHCPAFILTGDTHQLGPVITASDESNKTSYPFCNAAAVSIFERLKLTGYAAVELTRTERHNTFINEVLKSMIPAVDNIVAPANDKRPEKGQYERLFKKMSPGLWIETTGSHKLSPTKSKMNDTNVSAVLDYILRWTAQAPIADRLDIRKVLIVTCYRAQQSLYKQAVRRLSKALRSLQTATAEKVAEYKLQSDVNLQALADDLEASLLSSIVTADCVQGGQKSLLIYDLVTSSSLGFLERNARNYTAVSRAMDGLVVVGNLGGILDAASKRKWHTGTAVSRLAHYFQMRRLQISYKVHEPSLSEDHVKAVLSTIRSTDTETLGGSIEGSANAPDNNSQPTPSDWSQHQPEPQQEWVEVPPPEWSQDPPNPLLEGDNENDWQTQEAGFPGGTEDDENGMQEEEDDIPGTIGDVTDSQEEDNGAVGDESGSQEEDEGAVGDESDSQEEADGTAEGVAIADGAEMVV